MNKAEQETESEIITYFICARIFQQTAEFAFEIDECFFDRTVLIVPD